jgi:hypothetical protein
MKMAKVGVLFDQKAAARRREQGINVFEEYIGEILAHAGIPFLWLYDAAELNSDNYDVLLVALESEEEQAALHIWHFAEMGGHVVSYAGLKSLQYKLGFYSTKFMDGYAVLAEEYSDSRALRFVQADHWSASDASSYSAAENGQLYKDQSGELPLGTALLQFKVGQGSIDRWAVDLIGTIVCIQQGTTPVLEDGVPAPDGSGPVDDGVLKADDGVVQDWEWDRLRTETSAPYFAHPYADLWREVMVGHLLQRIMQAGMTLPFIGLWPDGISQVSMISFDSDINLIEAAVTTLDVLKELDISTTWCMIEPGYPVEIYNRASDEGHELAFHYNAYSGDQGIWSEEEFVRQFHWLQSATGLSQVTSNKNHYTRFEGWGELFRWCESCGISSDQTRGPSKKGNIGFLFGTCHPYFPIAWHDEQNRLYDVLEIGFLTQDLDHPRLADSSVIVPFLEQVLRVKGVAHFLFHQHHIHHQPTVLNALQKVVCEAKERGFVFWTGKKINDWERARRKVSIGGIHEDGSVIVKGMEEIDNLVVWYPVLDQKYAEADKDELERHFGVMCRKQVCFRK